MRSLLLAASAALLLTGAPAFAQISPPANKPATDTLFVHHVARDGLAEVQAGTLAEQRAQSPEVKSFAQRLVQDHTKANDELKQIAQQQGISIPPGIGKKNTAAMQKLEKFHGETFDRAFVQSQVKDHQEDIHYLESHLKSLHDPQLKIFAQNTLPVLQQHLQIAEGLAPAAEGSSRSWGSETGGTRR